MAAITKNNKIAALCELSLTLHGLNFISCGLNLTLQYLDYQFPAGDIKSERIFCESLTNHFMPWL